MLVRSLLTLALLGAATLTAAETVPAAPVVCSAQISSGDLAVGIDLITDVTCQAGGVGCLGTVCRFCKHQSTPSSNHLMSCPSTMSLSPTPSTSSTAPSPATGCEALLSVGDKAVGILTARDTSCATGGVGCISAACRYCRAQTTPQSQHLTACSSFTGSASTPQPTTSTSTSQPPTASSTNACANLLSSGDRIVGISVASDTSCSTHAASVGCVGSSSCRFCRVLETPQSKHLQLCSSILSYVDSAPALRASTATGEQEVKSESQGESVGWATPMVGVAVVAAVAIAAFVAKRAREHSSEDALVTPTNVIHRNEPLCTI